MKSGEQVDYGRVDYILEVIQNIITAHSETGFLCLCMKYLGNC